MPIQRAIEMEPQEKLHEINGEFLTYHQIAEKYKISYALLVNRICRQKMTIEQAVSTKVKKPETIEHNGKRYTVA